MKVVGVTLNSGQLAALDIAAESDGLTRAAFMRRLLLQWLRWNQEKEKEKSDEEAAL